MSLSRHHPRKHHDDTLTSLHGRARSFRSPTLSIPPSHRQDRGLPSIFSTTEPGISEPPGAHSRCYRQVAYLPDPAACPLKAVMGRCDRCSCRDRDMSNRARYECISTVSWPSVLWALYHPEIENNAILLDTCNGERRDEVFDKRVEVVFQWAWRVHRRALVQDGKPIRISQPLMTHLRRPSFPGRAGEEHRNGGVF